MGTGMPQNFDPPYVALRRIEALHCIMHSAVYVSNSPDYTDSYRCVVSVAADSAQKRYHTYLRGEEVAETIRKQLKRENALPMGFVVNLTPGSGWNIRFTDNDGETK